MPKQSKNPRKSSASKRGYSQPKPGKVDKDMDTMYGGNYKVTAKKPTRKKRGY